ncbi:MAG TPA: phospholipase D-like domain-containing protein [Terriglobales bacterium]|nr:phospholipase D-like domain-containing protein [Terriglobales bacterium]
MAFLSGSKNSFQVKAYIGDNKTLLAFNFSSAAAAGNLAGFSIFCKPPNQSGYYLLNELQFQDPSKHAQVPGEKPNSTANAPIQKYRWTHVPGSSHQGLSPATGNYTYTVTPRYFDANHSMKPLDSSLSAAITVAVGPFKKGALALGFTRGYMQSEAFARHFGSKTPIEPAGNPLQFDTSATAGTNAQGQSVKYSDIYGWMGSTARQQVFDVLNSVINDPSLHLDVFAYDLDEPDVLTMFLKLAAQGRMRIILDNSSEHHTADGNTKKEDKFANLFAQQAKSPAAIVRGCFNRYSHDKIFIVSKNGIATQVLTGSTNFSVTGLYVNANHVLVFSDPGVAAEYAKVFQQSWQILSQTKTPSAAAANAFAATPLATQPYTGPASPPTMTINFSPHTAADASKILGGISARITQEASVQGGNVMFAVMQLTGSNTPVYNTLNKVHGNPNLFSYGISDAPEGTFFYSAGSKDGVLVTGKPGQTTLPPPFDQVPIPPGHEIHDKFVVCGLNGKDPVVYCGSSNLASGGEAANGDNLLEIHDADVATAFAIEALLLVDHYAFLDRYANPKKPKPANGSPAKGTAQVAASKTAATVNPVKTAAKTMASRSASAKTAGEN